MKAIVWSDMFGSAPAAVIAKLGAGMYDLTFQDAAPSTKTLRKARQTETSYEKSQPFKKIF